MINVHASLLPRWRGASPIHRAVMAGDAETGISIMRVVQELDAGGVFATARRPIGPDETSEDVERDLAEIGGRLILPVIEALASGTARETPQDESLVTYAPRLTREEGLVSWERPATRTSQPGARPLPVAARLHIARRRAGDRAAILCGQATTNARPHPPVQARSCASTATASS